MHAKVKARRRCTGSVRRAERLLWWIGAWLREHTASGVVEAGDTMTTRGWLERHQCRTRRRRGDEGLGEEATAAPEEGTAAASKNLRPSPPVILVPFICLRLVMHPLPPAFGSASGWFARGDGARCVVGALGVGGGVQRCAWSCSRKTAHGRVIGLADL